MENTGGAKDDTQPLVLGLPNDGLMSRHRGKMVGLRASSAVWLLSQCGIHELGPGGQQSVSVLKESWAWGQSADQAG